MDNISAAISRNRIKQADVTRAIIHMHSPGATSHSLEQLFLSCASGNQGIKAAELKLQEYRLMDTNYPLLLLDIIAKAKELEIQLRASIEFKLWCRQYATLEQFDADRYSSVMGGIKNQSLSLYLTINDKPYKQMKESIVHLCQREYFEGWKELPQQLIGVAGQNYGYLIRVLSLFKKITHRYSYELRSDPLYEEIIYSCNEMHDFLLSTSEFLLNTIQQTLQEDNLKAMKEALKLFYNLNYQDLHPHFEDNLNKWMQILIQTLRLQGPSDNPQLFKCKGAALKSILLYSSKYHDDIESCVEVFSAQIWKLFTDHSSISADHEKILLDGLKYFRHLIVWSGQKKTYENNIPALIQTLVLPNIGVSQDVIDDFEEDADKFIDSYFECNETDTKRSFAIDLLKSINRIYPHQTADFIVKFITTQTASQLSIKDECMMYNLLVDGGSSAYRSIEGVTNLSISQDIIKGCYLNMLKPKFQMVYEWILKNGQKEVETNFNAIQIAFQLRFIFSFRIYIPAEDLSLLLKYTSSLISNLPTLRNIIYLTVNAFLTVRHGDYVTYKNLEYYFKPENIDGVALDILKAIYTNQQKEDKLNPRLNTLLQSVTLIFKQNILHYQQHMLMILSSLLTKTDHYEFKTISHVFEAFGYFLFWVVSQGGNIDEVEKLLNSYMDKLMASNSDLINFLLQLYSIVVLEKTLLTERYHSIYKSLISPSNWSQNNSSLFNSYSLFITSYLSKHKECILKDMTAIEIILSRLIELKKPAIFFTILNEIYKNCELQNFNSTGYLKVVIIGTQAMVASQSEHKNHILKNVLLFICNIINKNNPQVVTQCINNCQQGFLENLLSESINIISTITWRDERKPIIIAMCSLLNNNCFSTIEAWGIILNALVKNTNRRVRFSSLSTNSALNTAGPVESSFQKLGAFKLIKSAEAEKGGETKFQDEERYFVECIQKIIKENGLVKVGSVLSEDNQKQLSLLIAKYQQESQPVV